MKQTIIICPNCNKSFTLENTKIKILKFLYKNGISNIKTLEKITNKSHSNVFDQLESMIKEGYISKEKIIINNERKEFKISLTNKGKRLLEDLR